MLLTFISSFSSLLMCFISFQTNLHFSGYVIGRVLLHWKKNKRESLLDLFYPKVLHVFESENESEVAQSCLTLCNPMDCSLPGSSVHGILQARTLEWVAFPSPRHESEKWKWSHSVVSDSVWSQRLQPTRLLYPWDFPGKSTSCCC